MKKWLLFYQKKSYLQLLIECDILFYMYIDKNKKQVLRLLNELFNIPSDGTDKKFIQDFIKSRNWIENKDFVYFSFEGLNRECLDGDLLFYAILTYVNTFEKKSKIQELLAYTSSDEESNTYFSNYASELDSASEQE